MSCLQAHLRPIIYLYHTVISPASISLLKLLLWIVIKQNITTIYNYDDSTLLFYYIKLPIVLHSSIICISKWQTSALTTIKQGRAFNISMYYFVLKKDWYWIENANEGTRVTQIAERFDPIKWYKSLSKCLILVT